MNEWRPFSQDVRESWERLVFLVRDAQAHRELRWIPVVIGGPALWALGWWWQVSRSMTPTSMLTMIEVVAGVPAAFLGAWAWELRRDRRARARGMADEQDRQEREQRQLEHSIQRGNIQTYKLVRGRNATSWGLPRTEHFQEVATAPGGGLIGIDHEVGEIRPAHEPDPRENVIASSEEDDDFYPTAPPVRAVKRRHSKYRPLA